MSERIVTAAVRVRGRLFLGPSHKVAVYDAARRLRLSPATVWATSTRGFVTTTGRFVSRTEGAKIAHRAGQIRERVPELFSEMLR